MRYLALATDYDGTVATHGAVDPGTRDALARVKRSGRKLLLVTGREVPDLRNAFPGLDIFDLVVAENGALLYYPDTRAERVLVEGPPSRFADLLRKENVTPLSVGRVIVATTEPNETFVLHAIRELGLELQVIFNKGAVMVLPTGVNKATGLAAALDELGLSRHNVIGVGDAENDHAFLEFCECGAAVANALPALKQRADLVTHHTHGAGVSEVIDHLLQDEMACFRPKRHRHDIPLGIDEAGGEIRLEPFANSVLIAGPAESERGALIRALAGRLAERQYQTCLLHASNHWPPLDNFVGAGSRDRPPSLQRIIEILDAPRANVLIHPGEPRSAASSLVGTLLKTLGEIHLQTGRPHWLVLDDADHLLPPGVQPFRPAVPELSILLAAENLAKIPGHWLRSIRLLLMMGDGAGARLQEFSRAIGQRAPDIGGEVRPGEIGVWNLPEDRAFRLQPFNETVIR